MTTFFRMPFALAAAVVLQFGSASSLQATEEGNDDIIPPKAIYKPDPTHPQELYDRGIEGEAIIIVAIDQLGSVLDPIVEKATNEEFGLAAMLAASEWIFEPATKRGVPIEIRARIPFEFKIAFEHKLNVELGREVFQEIEFPVIPSFELDQSPLPTFVPALVDYYPEALRSTGQSASVSVEFIIDPSGNVINPRVISQSADGFQESAIRAVSHMKYKPIRVEGQPVFVSLMMPLQLSP